MCRRGRFVATCGGALRRWALRRRAEALRDGQRGPAARRGGGVCVCAGANGAAVCGNVRRRGVFVCQRAGGLRRFADALRGGRRGPAAPPRPVFFV